MKDILPNASPDEPVEADERRVAAEAVCSRAVVEVISVHFHAGDKQASHNSYFTALEPNFPPPGRHGVNGISAVALLKSFGLLSNHFASSILHDGQIPADFAAPLTLSRVAPIDASISRVAKPGRPQRKKFAFISSPYVSTTVIQACAPG